MLCASCIRVRFCLLARAWLYKHNLIFRIQKKNKKRQWRYQQNNFFLFLSFLLRFSVYNFAIVNANQSPYNFFRERTFERNENVLFINLIIICGWYENELIFLLLIQSVRVNFIARAEKNKSTYIHEYKKYGFIFEQRGFICYSLLLKTSSSALARFNFWTEVDFCAKPFA
jgi:hypothetical protein